MENIQTVKRDLDKFNDHVSVNSTIRISNTVKYLNDKDYDNAHEAIADAMTYLVNGEKSVWVLVTDKGQGMADIDLVKNCPYWIARFRSKKLNTDGSLSFTPKTTASPSKIKLLQAQNALLLAKLQELESKMAG